MYTFLIILALIICTFLILIVLVQNPKGGGLASNFAASNQIMGVKRTGDFLEKATWTLAIALLVICLGVNMFQPGNDEGIVTEESDIQEQVDNASTAPKQQALPQQPAVAPNTTDTSKK